MLVVTMQVSVALHSVFVGLVLGVVTHNQAEVTAFAVSLLFHQFFEGFVLGMAAVRARLSRQATACLVATFSLSCPLGGVAGIYASAAYDDDSQWTDWALGILKALAAGMLFQVGVCELLAEDFGDHADAAASHVHGRGVKAPRDWGFRAAKLLALFSGGAVMTMLAERA